MKTQNEFGRLYIIEIRDKPTPRVPETDLLLDMRFNPARLRPAISCRQDHFSMALKNEIRFTTWSGIVSVKALVVGK